MPHIIIEASHNRLKVCSTQRLVEHAFNSVLKTGLFSADNIKVRLYVTDDYCLGLNKSLSDDKHGFVHVMCRIHAGKTESQKKQLTNALLDSLEGRISSPTVITIEVIEMDRSSYAKKVI